MLGVGDQIKIVRGSHSKGPPSHLIGQVGIIVSYVGHSPGKVVLFLSGETHEFWDEEMEALPRMGQEEP